MVTQVGYDCNVCKGRMFEILSHTDGTEKQTGKLVVCCVNCNTKIKITAEVVKNSKKEKKQSYVRYVGDIKYIITENVVVAVKHGEDGKYVKAIAKCHPDDIFNEVVGMTIAKKRLDLQEVQQKLDQLIGSKLFLEHTLSQLIK